jgi:hypothetical protein
MPKKHIIKLGICPPINFSSYTVELIDFRDSKKRPAIDYGKNSDDPVRKQEIICFKSSSPFMFISYTPEDWQPWRANHGPVVWTQEGGLNWCVTVYSKAKSAFRHVLELAIVTIQDPAPGNYYGISYRIVGLEAASFSSRAGRTQAEKTLARLRPAICGGMKITANPGKPTINITGS